MKRKRESMVQLVCGLLAVLMLCGAAGASGAEIIHCDPNHGDHEFSGNTCTVCGWMKPGFYMDGEMVLDWEELKSMGYVKVDESGRLVDVEGNLDGKLVIDEEVTRMDGNFYPLFSGSPLQEVWIPRTVTELGRYLISRTAIREVRLFCPVTKLEDDAFSESLNDQGHLEHVWLPDTLTEIGHGAFYECTALQELELPDTVEKLGGSMLYDSGLQQMKIPSRLRDASSAFYSCQLQEIVLPETVERLGQQGFCYCDAKTVDLSKTQITVLPDQCFQYCKKLETLILPQGLEAFGWACFADNYALKRLVLPDGFTSMGNSWFDYVEELVWPVSLIDVNGFGPGNLKTIYYRGTEKQWMLNGANSKWDMSGITVICNYTGD